MSAAAIVEVKNRPTSAGRALGAQLARLTDVEEAKLRQRYPNHKERCTSCAFRGGTFPNGCEITLMDAIKCVVEGKDFMCHEHFDARGHPTQICMGYMIALSSGLSENPQMKEIVAPWEYSR